MYSKFLLFILTLTILPVYARDEYFPFKVNPSSVIERAIGPQDTDVTMIINNLPYHLKPKAQQIQLEEKLVQAVQSAKKQYSPEKIRISTGLESACSPEVQREAKLIVGDPSLSMEIEGGQCYWYYDLPGVQTNPEQLCKTLELLTIFYYKEGKYNQAIDLLQNCLDTQLALYGPDDLKIAQTHDLIGQIARSAHDFALAEGHYKVSLAIREKASGNNQKKIASSYINMAMNSLDQFNGKAVITAEMKAKDIVGDSCFVSATLSNGPRPIPTSINGAVYSEWSNIELEAETVVNYYKMVDAQREAQVRHITAILKRVLGQLCKLEVEEIATIQGTLRVVKDKLAINMTKTKTSKETDIGGGEWSVTEQKNDKQDDFKNQPVMLVTESAQKKIDSALNDYAQEHGLSVDKFGKGWPTIEVEANEVRRLLDNSVTAIQTENTTKHGDFRFKPVPKGTYYIYSSLNNGEEAILWLIGPIKCTKPQTLTYNLGYENAKAILWKKQ